MSAAIRRRSGLPEATLAAGLLVLLDMVVNQATMLYDIAWHATPQMREASGGIFGLPHPWTLAHIGLVIGVPISFAGRGSLMAAVLQSGVGGLVGALVGVAGAYAVNRLTNGLRAPTAELRSSAPAQA